MTKTIAVAGLVFTGAVFLLASIAPGAGPATPPATEGSPTAATQPAPATRPVTRLPGILVTATALDAAQDEIVPSLGATKYSRSADQLDTQSQGANASLDQTMLRFPGVVQDELDKRLHVRGEEANLQYRINDVLLPDGLFGFGQELSTRFVDRLSLINGSLPAQYGLRTAGIVDIRTKSGENMQGGSLSFYGGSNNTLNESIEYGQTAGNLTCYVTASELHNNIGLANPASTSEPIHDASDQTGGFIYLSYVLDEASRISLIMNGSNNAFQIPNIKGQTPVYSYQGRTTFDSAALNENQVEQSCFEVLTYQVERDDLSCQISQFTRYGSVDYKPDMAGDLMFNGVASRDDHVLVSNGLQTDASYRADKFNTIRGGLSVTVEHARVNTSNWVFPVDSSGNQTSTNAYDIIDDSSKTGYCYGCYLQDEWKATKWLTINYGARFDVYEGYTCENQLSPRINAVIEASKDTMLHLGYAKYFTPPPLYCVSQSSLEKFDGTSHEEENTQSSPAKCERCDCFDTGVTQKIGQGFQAGLDGYYKIKKNVLDEGQFGSAWIFSPYNAERGQVCGAELSLNYTYEGFSTYGNVAWSQAIAQGLTTGQFQFDPVEEQYLQTHWYHLDHDQPWTASMGASYKLHDTTVYMDALYGNGLFGGFANTQELGSYVTVNVGIVQKLKIDDKQSCKLRFDIVNVFDTVYAIRTGDGIGVYAPQYLPRRSFYAGISWEF